MNQQRCFVSSVGQMVVAKALSRLYADMLLYGQSIVYYEHCVSVCRELKDKRLEGEYLEILSSLYLTLNTERCNSARAHISSVDSAAGAGFLPGFNPLHVDFRSSRKSLDYTKQSLRISIDLGKREEESETWLQVGRIYHLIQEDELADMYLQVRGVLGGRGWLGAGTKTWTQTWISHGQAAVKTALRMNDSHFAMSIYEEAGDVYFKSHRNQMASLPFYRVM